MTELKIEQRHRDAAWPFRPDCYAPSDLEKWRIGAYDHVPIIKAFAELEANSLRYFAHKSREIQKGWLIEHEDEPKWLTLRPGESAYQVCWTKDSLDALRFSRRSDADDYASSFMDEGPIRITEHQWFDPLVQASFRPTGPDAVREAITKVRDGYASQMKFCDIEALDYFREFVRRIDTALRTEPAAPASMVEEKP